MSSASRQNGLLSRVKEVTLEDGPRSGIQPGREISVPIGWLQANRSIQFAGVRREVANSIPGNACKVVDPSLQPAICRLVLPVCFAQNMSLQACQSDRYGRSYRALKRPYAEQWRRDSLSHGHGDMENDKGTGCRQIDVGAVELDVGVCRLPTA